MARFILIGLIEPPSPDQQELFDEWYLGQHVYDTALCPNFLSGTVYKLRGGHVGIETPSEYICIYEVDAESYEEAETVLNEWQRDPNAWKGRSEHNELLAGTDAPPLSVKGSGWYEFERGYHTRG
ncbi:MAG: hypothetical protein CL897_02510 [Dehalococcoidia bacterium]|nr:hypothetical protein [Dehalococcoidia bacterium]|tara:strand:- start:536 stop:910 length:375 start_codon:yes stop_codon:yes gene_type:complete